MRQFFRVWHLSISLLLAGSLSGCQTGESVKEKIGTNQNNRIEGGKIMVAEVGKQAPAFILPAGEGGKISLADYVGKNVVVLYFYPKDMTPGCTTEACNFRDESSAIKKLGAVVLGVSPDSPKSHVRFAEQQRLNFPLLADEDHAVCEQYGVWTEKTMAGHKYMGVERSTFLIDKAGKITREWRKVKVDGHVQEVVAAIRKLKD